MCMRACVRACVSACAHRCVYMCGRRRRCCRRRRRRRRRVLPCTASVGPLLRGARFSRTWSRAVVVRALFSGPVATRSHDRFPVDLSAIIAAGSRSAVFLGRRRVRGRSRTRRRRRRAPDSLVTSRDPIRGHRQVGSLTGAVHLSKNNAGVLRPAQRGRKPRVEQKGKSWLDPGRSVRVGTAKASASRSSRPLKSFQREVSEKLPQG